MFPALFHLPINMTNKTNFIDTQHEFLDGDSKDEVVLRRYQEIPDSFLDEIKDIRNESSNKPMGDFHHYARIPDGVIEKWMMEGFDIFNADPKEILKKLHSDELDKLICTTKRLG